MKISILPAALLAGFGLSLSTAQTAQAAEPLNVVVTIKPVHSLASAVMQGAGEPQLLIDGAGSPHSYAMKPSQARRLNSADIIIRVSETLETFLEKPIASLSGQAKVITLAEIPGLKLLPVREGGAFDEHEHEEEHEHGAEHADHSGAKEEHDHAHEQEGHDSHLWLDPANAAAIADHLAVAFAEARPEMADIFTANAKALKARLNELDTSLRRSLAPLKGKPFIVFHDAYQYLEDAYGVRAAGSVTLSPERQIGAARLQEIRRKIGEASVACVFSEPQFTPKLLATITEGTDAKTGVLDPLGADLAPGKEQYFQLMTNLANSLTQCLTGSS
jgi:zinc transport system substrate-binding protein